MRSAKNKPIDKEIFFQNHNKGRPVALSGSHVGFTVFRRAINEENKDTRAPYRQHLQVQSRLNNWEIARKNKQGEFKMWLKTKKLSEGKKTCKEICLGWEREIEEKITTLGQHCPLVSST